MKPTKDSSVLIVFNVGSGTDDCAEIEILNLLIELVDPIAPLLFSGLALHFVLIDGGSGIEFGELSHERLVDFVIHLSETQLRALHLLEDRRVCHEVFDSCGKTRPSADVGIRGSVSYQISTEI